MAIRCDVFGAEKHPGADNVPITAIQLAEHLMIYCTLVWTPPRPLPKYELPTAILADISGRSSSPLATPYLTFCIWPPQASVPTLFSKQASNPPQHTVFLRIVRVVFAWDLQDSWEGSGVGINSVTYSVGDLCGIEKLDAMFSRGESSPKEGGGTCVLVDQDNPNVLAFDE